jgi:hypothetical protein
MVFFIAKKPLETKGLLSFLASGKKQRPQNFSENAPLLLNWLF